MKQNLLFIFCLFNLLGSAQIDLVSNLKVCMPFTGNANDLSGNNLNGMVSSATLTTDRFGVANRAYQFNAANNSFISVNSFSNIAPTDELTISMWAKSDITTSNCLFIINPDNQNDRCVGCAQYLNGGSTMMIWDYGDILSNGRIVVYSIPADVTNWHHYAYVISQSGNIKRMYLDGVSNALTPYTMTVNNKNRPFYIGGGFSNGTSGKIMWSGKIDDVYIYNRALTAAEVSALYTATNVCQTGTTTPPPPVDPRTVTLTIPGGTVVSPTVQITSPPTPSTPGVADVLAELKKAEQLLVYPTVSEGVFTVINHDPDFQTIQVFNMAGRLILSISAKEAGGSVNLTDYERGIYLLKVTGRKKNFTQKIIKN